MQGGLVPERIPTSQLKNISKLKFFQEIPGYGRAVCFIMGGALLSNIPGQHWLGQVVKVQI